MIEKPIREDLLHYIWRLKRFDHKDLHTTDGQKIEILNYGRYNTDAGPDFLEGRVKIGATIWVGQIEMHVSSSDWLLHKHQFDPRYNNVILHVVFDPDREIQDRHGNDLPCLDISTRIDTFTQKNYAQLIQSESWIPCQRLFKSIDPLKLNIWLESLLGQRLENKTLELKQRLVEEKGDWESLFYRTVARTLGLKVNADAMDALARAVPLKILQKKQDQLIQIEALLFGQSNLLSEKVKDDDYVRILSKEYEHLKVKYGLQPVERLLWKFSRMRPVSFPTVRIAQLAAILNKSTKLFQWIRDQEDLNTILDIFNVDASLYWDSHFRFGKRAKQNTPKRIGRSTIDLLFINAVVPTLFLYGNEVDDYSYCQKAINLLEKLKPEINTITKGFKNLKLSAEHAGQSQALIHLKTKYCDAKKCLSCSIGHELMKN